ncbi:hypothetical protein ACI4BF_28380, partial [Klebsiella pneumoniae]|uniref:hypothetical protein n=1 Tax=Klebsiella pneumoniae TaxID=573 RepID=UPI00385505C2
MALTAPVRPYLIQLTVNTAIGKNQVIPAWVKTILLGIDLSNITKFIIAVTLFQLVFIIVE